MGVTFVYLVSARHVFRSQRTDLHRLFVLYAVYQVAAVALASGAVEAITNALDGAYLLGKTAVLPVTFTANFLFMSWLLRDRAATRPADGLTAPGPEAVRPDGVGRVAGQGTSGSGTTAPNSPRVGQLGEEDAVSEPRVAGVGSPSASARGCSSATLAAASCSGTSGATALPSGASRRERPVPSAVAYTGAAGAARARARPRGSRARARRRR
jgi:hypothetical protein